MKAPFKFKDVHTCEAVVLSCIDFRFWKKTVQFVEQEMGVESFDFPSLPGAAKAINESNGSDLAMSCISVPVKLHHVKKIIIVNHQDCGAYGGSAKFAGDETAEQKFHEEQLKLAKEKISANYPDQEIILVYAKLVDDKCNIEFVKVE